MPDWGPPKEIEKISKVGFRFSAGPGIRFDHDEHKFIFTTDDDDCRRSGRRRRRRRRSFERRLPEVERRQPVRCLAKDLGQLSLGFRRRGRVKPLEQDPPFPGPKFF